MGYDYYKEFSLFYDEFRGRNLQLLFEIPLQFFGFACNKEAGPFLDLGCGTGDLAIYFAEKGFEVTGVDLSLGMLEAARAKVDQKKLKNIRLLQQDIVELDLEPGFAYIHARETFMHFNAEQLEKVFKKCWRALKPEGIFLFEIMTPFGLKKFCNGVSNRTSNNCKYTINGIFNDIDNSAILNYEFLFTDGRQSIFSLKCSGHDLLQICPLLAGTGFKKICAFDLDNSLTFENGVLKVGLPSIVSDNTSSMMVCVKKELQA